MSIIHIIKQIDFYMKNPKAFMKFFRNHIIAFILTIVVFVLLYAYIAESGRRKALEDNGKIDKRYIHRLENEIKSTKTDFYDLQKQITENDSSFYNQNFDAYMDVNVLLNNMRNRFNADGIPQTTNHRDR